MEVLVIVRGSRRQWELLTKREGVRGRAQPRLSKVGLVVHLCGAVNINAKKIV